MKPITITLLFAFGAMASAAQTISGDSLVLLLPFNGDAMDQSGNNYHGIVKGATVTTGINNQPAGAYYFNGTSSAIIIPNITKLDRPLPAFTILIRLQPQDIYNDPAIQAPFTATYNFLTWYRNQPDSSQAFLRSKMRTGWQAAGGGSAPNVDFLSYVMDWCSVGTASGYQRDTSEINNQWVTVAYVYKEGTLRIFHNCIEVNHWTNYPAINGMCGTEPVEISLGNVPKAVFQYGYRYFKGKIDELRVYTRALTDTEVKSFAGPFCTTPVVFKPAIKIKANDCYPDSVAITDATDTTGMGITRRLWQMGNGDTSNAPAFTYAFTAKGAYNIKLSLYTATGVYTKDTTINITTLGARKFLPSATMEETVCSGRSFQPSLPGGINYQWQPCTYLSNCTGPAPLITPATDISYTITATDAFSCNDTAMLKINVPNDSIPVYIPSAFTPNNDGRNDRFGVAGPQVLSDFSLQVFNRWGGMVFQTKNSATGWNGKINNTPAPAGIYVWVMHYKNGKGCGAKTTTGTVALIR